MAETKGFKDRLTGTTYDLKDATAREGVATNAEAISGLDGKFEAALAPTFDTSTAYTTGQFVWYSGKLYRFTTNHAAGSWNAAQVELADVANDLVGDVSDLKSQIDDLYDLMPTTEAHDWEEYPYTTTSGYISRSGTQSASQYSDFVEITYSAGSQYKISGRCPNNTTISPILYKDSNGNVLGTEPSTDDTVFSNYLLTIPDGTNKIYINWTPQGSSGVQNLIYIKQATAYTKAASEQSVQAKLNAPSSAGAIGQVLTSDGSDGSEWADFPIDATLTESGKAADAKATGDAIAEVRNKLPMVYTRLSLTMVDNKYMQLNLTPRDLNGYKYTYVEIEANTRYKVTAKSACNSALAPVIYVDSNGQLAGQYPTETSSSDVVLTEELLNVPANAVGMYINSNVGANVNPIYVDAGTIADVEPALDYTQYTWNAIGDSITYNGRYEEEVKSILGLPYTNGGVSSSTLAINDTYMTGQSIVERILAGTYTDADIWTVMGGLNDCLYDSPLGQLASAGSTFDKTTVYGALQAICEYVLNLRAHQRLILMTPTQSVRDTWSATTHPTTMAQIRQAVLDVAEYYSVTCFDAWAKSGVSAYNIQKATNPTTSDGVHLNVLGADMLGEKLALCIKDQLFGITDD